MTMFTATWATTEREITINADHVLAFYQMDGYTSIMTTVSNGSGGSFMLAVRESASEIEERISNALSSGRR
ncbi:hypothetical protein [Rhizobium phaseoli]|uniref:hypothetical protein n=1 Tax=Rhizobium phaseoli TaxID=396 RepID=UPI000559F59F|nr:hypothetical protein [Rhizobium phaseoli]ANL34097.1 hypothetical protein AMC89_CH02037 [Rhizobium phaseoli]ANL52847.1 hypothetical protein AMC86_CH01685 [Rhizobium phaseoli]ANL97820.1 hypothetical protein AMC79_CH02030 [Rhizobium phaseoli]PWI54471.1 hypothetical protein B5K03_09860 [Rhizobium phaseoli]